MKLFHNLIWWSYWTGGNACLIVSLRFLHICFKWQLELFASNSKLPPQAITSTFSQQFDAPWPLEMMNVSCITREHIYFNFLPNEAEKIPQNFESWNSGEIFIFFVHVFIYLPPKVKTKKKNIQNNSVKQILTVYSSFIARNMWNWEDGQSRNKACWSKPTQRKD